MFLYKSSDFRGELKASDEGKVMWVPLRDIGTLDLASGMMSLVSIMDEGKFSEQFFVIENGEFVEYMK